MDATSSREIDWYAVLLEGAKRTGAQKKLSIHELRHMAIAVREQLQRPATFVDRRTLDEAMNEAQQRLASDLDRCADILEDATPAASAVAKCSTCGRWTPADAVTCWGCEYDEVSRMLKQSHANVEELTATIFNRPAASAVDVEARDRVLQLCRSARVRRERIDALGFKHDQLTSRELDELLEAAERIAASAGKER